MKVSTKLQPPCIHVLHREQKLLFRIEGDWLLSIPRSPQTNEALATLRRGHYEELILETGTIGAWDTALLSLLVECITIAEEKNIPVVKKLPEEFERLLSLSFAVKKKEGSDRKQKKESFVSHLGGAILAFPVSFRDFASFLGDVVLAVGRLFTGKSTMRTSSLAEAMYECGICSLPIVAVTNLLFGLILAFVGAVQLTQFGAQIYTAGLVGIGVLRVMGAIMVGVVMAGRIGAAYAALIGTMQVNEEVDALETMGISPIDFLVIPRMIALSIMVPLLTVFADLMGILGGFSVAIAMLDLSAMEYIEATKTMVKYSNIFIGLSYSAVFGIIIALCGCYQGIRCGRSAQAVGLATTTAVVHSLVGIIVATAIITVIYNILQV